MAGQKNVQPQAPGKRTKPAGKGQTPESSPEQSQDQAGGGSKTGLAKTAGKDKARKGR